MLMSERNMKLKKNQHQHFITNEIQDATEDVNCKDSYTSCTEWIFP